jgi:hypothetical protein
LLASLASRSARLARTRPRLLVLGTWPMKAHATPKRAKSKRHLNIVLSKVWGTRHQISGGERRT